jgi:hypothetical protein
MTGVPEQIGPPRGSDFGACSSILTLHAQLMPNRTVPRMLGVDPSRSAGSARR